MPPADPMPPRGSVDPVFDGHLERPLLALTADERLDWIWETMQLVRQARREAEAAAPARAVNGGSVPESSSSPATLVAAVSARRAAGLTLDHAALAALVGVLGGGPDLPTAWWDDAWVDDGPTLRIVVVCRNRPVAPGGPTGGLPMPFLYRATLVHGADAWRWERRMVDPASRQPAPGHDWEPMP